MSNAQSKQALFATNKLKQELDGVNEKVKAIDYALDGLTGFGRRLLITDASYSWWISPQAVFRKGVREKTYLGFIDNAGNQCVSSFDHITGQQETTVLDSGSEIDDHNAVAITFFNSGKPIVAYTRHGTDNVIRFRIGRNKESIRSFEDEVRLVANSNTTYAQIFRHSATIVIFYRTNAKGWCFRRSTDNGRTWEEERVFVDAKEQYYVKFVQKPDDPHILRLAMTGHPTNSSQQSIYVGSINLGTNDVRSFAGNSLGNLLTKNFVPSDFQLMLNPNEGIASRLLDVGYCEGIQIAYCLWDNTNDTNFTESAYWVAKWNGSTFVHEKVKMTGKPIDPDYATSRYFGGMHFVSRKMDELYLSREENGIFIIEHLKNVGSIWETTEIARDSSFPIYRPVSPIDADARMPVFWQRGSYSNFVNYNVDIISFSVE